MISVNLTSVNIPSRFHHKIVLIKAAILESCIKGCLCTTKKNFAVQMGSPRSLARIAKEIADERGPHAHD